MLNYTYLATPQDCAAFTPNDLVRHRYVALFGMGRHADQVPANELSLLFASLANFMNRDCLITMDSDLNDAPEQSYIRSIYHIFDAPPEKEAYVAVATVLPGVNDRILLNPVYHKLKWGKSDTSRYPCYNALNQCLEHLYGSLTYSSLDQLILPELPPASQGLVIPNGTRLAALRKDRGMTMEDVGRERSKQGLPTMERKSVSKAEKGEPVTKLVMQHIAEVLKESYSSVVREKATPPKGRFREVRLATGLSPNELAEKFGLPSPFILELLEAAVSIPADKLLFFHYHYKKILGELSLSSLICD